MPRRHRERLEIIGAILTFVKNKKEFKKTEIMRNVGLSFSQLKKYLSLLLKNELIIKTSKDTFEITEKGEEFLRRLNELKEMTSPKK